MAKTTTTTYYAQAEIKCLNCSSIYTLGSTIETLSIDVCGNCHPFYTGQDTVVDTAGRIEKFEARLAKSQSAAGAGLKKTKARKIRQTLADFEPEQTEASETKKEATPKQPKPVKAGAETPIQEVTAEKVDAAPTPEVDSQPTEAQPE